MSETPTISVVIPAYEAAGTIAEAVGSALSQDPPPHQVIVADDGSGDALEQALAPFRPDQVSLLRLPHAGVSASRNAACREANGEFVLFLDADDLLLPGKLAALGRLGGERPGLDILATDLWFELDGRRSGRFGEANAFPSAEEQRRTILERCFVAQAAVRRSRLLALGGFDESLRTGEDWDCLLRLVLDGSVAGFDDAPLAVYRIHDGSLTSSRAETFRDRVRILEKALANPNLRQDERPVAERMLAIQDARAALGDAQAAVAEDGPDVRQRGLALARASGGSLRDRACGLGLFAGPAFLRPWLGRRLGGRSQLSRRLPAAKASR
ncbi:MAG TPA: glycosyltransferase family A protein [Solirubrobacterales bacterium]|nr:glycosyltransferase family A protein [Solirubrobacterales bacterium]